MTISLLFLPVLFPTQFYGSLDFSPSNVDHWSHEVYGCGFSEEVPLRLSASSSMKKEHDSGACGGNSGAARSAMPLNSSLLMAEEDAPSQGKEGEEEIRMDCGGEQSKVCGIEEEASSQEEEGEEEIRMDCGGEQSKVCGIDEEKEGLIDVETPRKISVGCGQRQNEACKTDSETPAINHSIVITALSIIRSSSAAAEPPASVASQPTATNTETRKTASTVKVARPMCTLVTAVTRTTVESHRVVHTPMLVIHRVEESTHELPPPHKPAASGGVGGGGGGGSAAQLLESQNSDFLDLSEILPTVIASSSFASEVSAMIDVMGVIPFKTLPSDFETECMPKISQIVPLDCGNLFALTCTSLKLDNQPCSALLLYRITTEGRVEACPLARDIMYASEMWICPVAYSSCFDVDDDCSSVDDVDGSGKGEGGREPRVEKVLLAGLSQCGEVRLYDCAGGSLKELSRVLCESEPGMHQCDFTHCVYCPTTSSLFVSTSRGQVMSVRVSEKMAEESRRRRRRSEGMDTSDGSDCAIDWSLNEEDLGHLLSLVRTSPRGLSFTCSCPMDWKVISLEQVNRRSPMHVNPPPEQKQGPAATSWPSTSPSITNEKRWNYDNSVILQYEPPLEPALPKRLVCISTQCVVSLLS